LCKYLNINGIPYLTIVHLTLDSSLKVVNFQAEKTNIKHDFLGDLLGLNFPWLKPKLDYPKSTVIDDEESEEETDEQFNETLSKNSNLNFLSEMLKSLVVIGKESNKLELDPRRARKSANFLFMAFSSSTNVLVDRKLVESFVAFSKEFTAKHKIMFVYVNLKPNENQAKFVSHAVKSNDIEWFTINDLRMKVSKYIFKYFIIKT
jgi:hypothetical protein